MTTATAADAIIDLFRSRDDAALTALLASISDADYERSFPALLDFFALFDPRETWPSDSHSDTNVAALLRRINRMSAELKATTLATNAAQLLAVGEWWIRLFHELGQCGYDLEAALSVMFALFQQFDVQNDEVGKRLLFNAIDCLVWLHSEALLRHISGLLSHISIKQPKLVAEHSSLLLKALEHDVSSAVSSQLLFLVNSVYDSASDEVHKCVDCLVAYALGDHLSMVGALPILMKIAKRAPALLYAYVSDLWRLADDVRACAMLLLIFADLALHNPLLFRDYVPAIQRAAEEKRGGFTTAARLLGRVGRINVHHAQRCIAVLIAWIDDARDAANSLQFGMEVRAISGVYKSVLEAQLTSVQKWTKHADANLAELARRLLAYYVGAEPLLPEYIPERQHDEYGRLLKAARVEDRVELVEAESLSGEQLCYMADHPGNQAASTQQQEVCLYYRDTDLVGAEYVNILQLAAREIENRSAAGGATYKLHELLHVLTMQEEAIYGFLQRIQSRIPLPTMIANPEKFKGRLTLTFSCCRQYGPDWGFATTAWTKWLRLTLCLLCIKRPICINNTEGDIHALESVFWAVRTSVIDRYKLFHTLFEQPILSPNEEEEVIQDLQEHGFFRTFAWDVGAGGWKRKQAVTPKPVAVPMVIASPTPSTRRSNQGRPSAGDKDMWKVSLDINAVKYSGYMNKIGRIVPSIRMRWFQLESGMIAYYVDESLKKKQGEFPVTAIRSVSHLRDNMWFRLDTPDYHGGGYKLQAPSERAYKEWKEKINLVKSMLDHNGIE